MRIKHNSQQKANRGLLEIMGIGLSWLLVSLSIIWHYTPELVRFAYQICQSSLDMLLQHTIANRHLVIPFLLALILIRGLYLLLNRLWKTAGFNRSLSQFQHPLPERLQNVALQVGIAPHHVRCVQLETVHAFSLGVWQPKIWLTTNLLPLLDDDELKAVLCHEAHHCKQHDPLRLLISRLISDMFFFIPSLRKLADHNHLAQELAADAVAISQTGDSLFLASALHKLITSPQASKPISTVAISQLNITERRILALVSPQKPVSWQSSLPHWGTSLLMVAFLFGFLLLTEPLVHQTIVPCVSG